MTRQNPHGFTLIELLVVIALIGIMTAIASPSLSTYRARQPLDASVENIRTLLADGYTRSRATRSKFTVNCEQDNCTMYESYESAPDEEILQNSIQLNKDINITHVQINDTVLDFPYSLSFVPPYGDIIHTDTEGEASSTQAVVEYVFQHSGQKSLKKGIRVHTSSGLIEAFIPLPDSTPQ